MFKIAVVFFLIVIYLDTVHSDGFDNFMKKLPGWESVSATWQKVVKAIKRPVKIKRLGRTGRTKSTTKSTADVSLLNPTTDQPVPKYVEDISSVKPIEITDAKTKPCNRNKMSNSRKHQNIPIRKLDVIPLPQKISTRNNIMIISTPQTFTRKMMFTTSMDLTPTRQIIEEPKVRKAKVRLPYVTRPVWRGKEEWHLMQKPHFVMKGKENSEEFSSTSSRSRTSGQGTWQFVDDMR